MTEDHNKGMTVSYNLMNQPLEIEFNNTSTQARNKYIYTATGSKLKVAYLGAIERQQTSLRGATLNEDELTKVRTIDYISNKIYEDGVLSKILLGSGYYDTQDKKYYFYVHDHLGNNRIVADTKGNVVQSTEYYPFGLQYADGTGQEKQAYKYNGKEFDQMHGLNWYDYAARQYDPVVPHLPTPDPHSENYYSWSPYVYVGNNPILNIDPDGKDYWSTNDPNQIRAFLNSVGAGSNTHDFTGWNHATDAEFSANLTYNDETNKFYTSYGTVENGEATIVGVSFDANITPKTQDSYSDIIGKGMQVYKPRSGVLDYISYYLFGIGESYTDGINNWSVSASGHITGIKKVTVTPPSVSPVGSLAPKTIKSISPHAVNQSITRGGGF